MRWRENNGEFELSVRVVQGSRSRSEGVNHDECVEPRRGATRNMLPGEPVKTPDVFVGLGDDDL